MKGEMESKKDDLVQRIGELAKDAQREKRNHETYEKNTKEGAGKGPQRGERGISGVRYYALR